MTESHFNNIDSVISDLIINSRSSIEIATAWLTHKELIRLLQLQVSLFDIQIKIIISDDSINEKFSDLYESLTKKGIEFRIYKKKHQFDLMHNKFAIFDSQTVVTGSYNWTYSAETNLENIIVSKSNQNVINKFSGEFDRIFYLSEDLNQWKNKINIKKTLYELDDSKLWEFLRV